MGRAGVWDLAGLFLSLIDAFLPLTVFAGLVPINVFIETKQCTRTERE